MNEHELFFRRSSTFVYLQIIVLHAMNIAAFKRADDL